MIIAYPIIQPDATSYESILYPFLKCNGIAWPVLSQGTSTKRCNHGPVVYANACRQLITYARGGSKTLKNMILSEKSDDTIIEFGFRVPLWMYFKTDRT